ncbi:adenosine deaminase 2-like [Toxorhynchites rutilus septentrionalis]|uniref:adenosine deaminase 2-like n=1 Tax=Toxorhynchites rutilus septentrionalis TaxID=329112 RepID=UPI00247A14B3|nr:adenosine deaminase 2-like [Toxorhynchites rutilus septentrionalis]
MFRNSLIFLIICSAVNGASIDYLNRRQAVIDAEKKQATGGRVFLTAKESKADEILVVLKNQAVADGILNPDSYAPGMHFFEAKPLIDQSKVFRILKAMPKGSVLHLHTAAAVSSEWIIKNLTYRPEAKICKADGRFYLTARAFKLCSEDSLNSIQALRTENGTSALFDRWLESLINLKYNSLDTIHVDINTVWVEFEQMFSTIKEFLLYKPFFEAFCSRMLQEFFEDNVFYIELRTTFSKLYDSSGKSYEDFEVAKILTNVVDTFKEAHPEFIGVKVIYSKHRETGNGTAYDLLMTYTNLTTQFPNLVVGFDLVGQEDINFPLNVFLKDLHEFQKSSLYFFHAGETNGYGSDADLNLIDAVLLNSRRIGHGYSLYKHPVLWRAVKSKSIPLEVCPISNQVLRLVNDLRNHPAVFYVSESVPIVISCDDPGFWDSKGVSYDFYYALMSIAPKTAGIGFLKQIVWDSVKYSALTSNERTSFSRILQARWDVFLDDLISGNLSSL